jgi:polypeptide N-acetylgalactosaminyltransferase
VIPVITGIHHRPFQNDDENNNNNDATAAISQQFRIKNAGEMGKPVILNKESLSKEIQHLIDQGWEDNAFNQYVSDMISITRSLPDVRDPK